jgi:hypothetical protein
VHVWTPFTHEKHFLSDSDALVYPCCYPGQPQVILAFGGPSPDTFWLAYLYASRPGNNVECAFKQRFLSTRLGQSSTWPKVPRPGNDANVKEVVAN